MDFSSLTAAREILDPLWREALLKGRCWGSKKIKGNPFAASNITLALESELISITQNEDGSLRIHEFVRVERETDLGEVVRCCLEGAGLVVK